jgi:hypothetical protein
LSIDVYIPVSFGELIDKITILEIKSERIIQPERLENIKHELVLLNRIRDGLTLAGSPGIVTLAKELKAINQRIWDAEDIIHGPEQHTLADEDFLIQARVAFTQNDLRARAKRKMNDIVGSSIVEEKSYPSFE